MFKAPFSYQGRIGRREYILSWFISMFYALAVLIIFGSLNLIGLAVLLLIPAWMFHTCQAVKRGHDFGAEDLKIFFNPFIIINLFLEPGQLGENKFGPSPKKTNQK